MTDSLIHLGLPSTIWLASLGVLSIEQLSQVSLGIIGGFSWLVFLAGIVYFLLIVYAS